MKLSEFKKALLSLVDVPVEFEKPDGSLVSMHYHITEFGSVTKKFIDCGGVIRNESHTTFQLWIANDTDHRLDAKKILSVIEKFETQISAIDQELLAEYQTDTLGIYGLQFDGRRFKLTIRNADCLAPDRCGLPMSKPKIALADLQSGCCVPGTGCC